MVWLGVGLLVLVLVCGMNSCYIKQLNLDDSFGWGNLGFGIIEIITTMVITWRYREIIAIVVIIQTLYAI